MSSSLVRGLHTIIALFTIYNIQVTITYDRVYKRVIIMRIFRSDGLTARSIYKTPTSVQYDTDKRIEFRITKFPGSQAHRQWNFKIYKNNSESCYQPEPYVICYHFGFFTVRIR